MTDPRIEKLADLLISYSCELKAGENILIEATDIPNAFIQALVRKAYDAGGRPLVLLKSNEINRALLMGATKQQYDLIADVEKHQMDNVQCYIGVRGSHNVSELADVPTEKMNLYEQTVWRRVHHDVRVKNTRWVVLRWPHPAMAQMAEMSTEAFEDFYFNVCTMDYPKMAAAMVPLQQRMERADQVRIRGPKDTDLSFSIKDIPAVSCDGKLNIPDGEVFTAPVRESINGVIHFNAPTIYRGTTHNDIRLVFQNGRIVEATGTETDKLNEVLDADAGARYVGEFAIGFNPYCTRPMKDILFDEKIAGSIHLTPGACYEQASNGNKSDVHWDMVLLQTPDLGGGKIHFDGDLIRKDGRFVPEALQPLNPENLM